MSIFFQMNLILKEGRNHSHVKGDHWLYILYMTLLYSHINIFYQEISLCEGFCCYLGLHFQSHCGIHEVYTEGGAVELLVRLEACKMSDILISLLQQIVSMNRIFSFNLSDWGLCPTNGVGKTSQRAFSSPWPRLPTFGCCH